MSRAPLATGPAARRSAAAAAGVGVTACGGTGVGRLTTGGAEQPRERVVARRENAASARPRSDRRRHRTLRRQRVDEDAVALHAVIEMRPGGEPARSHAADQICPGARARHARTAIDGEVQVLGFESRWRAAGERGGRRRRSCPPPRRRRRDGDDGRAGRRAIVDAEMRPVLAKNRMKAAARKRRRDDRFEFQRRSQKESAHRDAVLVVVPGAPPGGREAHGATRRPSLSNSAARIGP